MTTRLRIGDPAPLFELPDTDGSAVRLDAAAQPATVVVFTANGCPYARAGHDRIQAPARPGDLLGWVDHRKEGTA